MSSTIIPAYLKKGDAIGIVCPSGYMPFEKMETCIQTLPAWGFQVKTGTTTKHQYNYFSGTDKERLDDLQAMIDDESIKAILCGRGGYGLSRIIDELNFEMLVQQPKWLIGYSDITLLLNHVLSVYNIGALHAPMAAAFNDGNHNSKFVVSIKDALQGKIMEYRCQVQPLNRQGTATGILAGGNLALLAHTVGSNSSILTKNKILFIEDIGEYKYNVDRMLLQLKRAGMLGELAGLIVGSFTDIKDTVIPFGQEIKNIIYDKVKEYDYPVCFDFPVGHTDENYALKIGVQHCLNVTLKDVQLTEIR